MSKLFFSAQEIPEYCVYCHDPAELMCGKCQQVYYCKADHQKIDWRRHSQNCVSILNRKLNQLENKRKKRLAIFQKIANGEILKAIQITNKVIEDENTFIKKYPKFDMQLEIQLGASYCLEIRLLIASKQFSTAQDILSDYFKQRNDFLNSTSNIQGKEELEQMKIEIKEKHLHLILGKLRLISTLANLMHQLIRNSVDMFEILISHVEKVYGLQSLELSNVYFYTANYLKFLNQDTKALACFLKAGKLRKQKGGTAYYNVALLLKDSKRKKKALEYFQKALELIEQENNIDNNYIIPEIYENIALIYLGEGMAKQMIDYFQRAYFYYQRHHLREGAERIMQFFQLIKKEAKQEGSDDMKMMEFTKERKEKRPNGSISGKNRQKYRNADRVAEEDSRKTIEWLSSFRQLKLANSQPTQFKPPKELEYLFGNELNKHQEEEHSLLTSDKYRHAMIQGINMDISYMRNLTSNQVGYLHELNRLLMDCKDSAAYYDIVENSHYYQTVNKDKLNQFYRLNPRLVRPTDLDRRLMLQVMNQQNQEDQEEDQYKPPPIMVQPITPTQKTPRLDLSKLKPIPQ